MSQLDSRAQYEFLQKYLNSARKESKSAEEKRKDKPSKTKESKKDDDWLTKKAIEELKREMCINKVKRKAFGTVTVPKARTNKRFLETTLSQCLSHNKRETKRHNIKSTDKLKQLDRESRLKKSKEKFGERKHEYKKPEKRKRRRRRSSSSSSSSSSPRRRRRRKSSSSSSDG